MAESATVTVYNFDLDAECGGQRSWCSREGTNMALTQGRRLGPYEIIAPLGAGGMGEVYRARDTKLGRDVAIKVLPPAFAADAARMARFEREAQMLASLNHPNIAAIYGIEQGAIVMELVEGEDLKGPLPVETALNYARQIAAALWRPRTRRASSIAT